jgi:hypothetical protein
LAALALAVALLLPSIAVAEEAPTAALDDAAVLVFPVITLGGDSASSAEGGDEAAAFGAALKAALGRALSEFSFTVKESSEALVQGEDLPVKASSIARAAGAGWAAVAFLEVADKRIAYTLRVYEVSESALASSAGFSVYAGLAALPLMDDSAKTVASKAAAYRASPARGVGEIIQYRISLTSPDEGAAVYIGAAGAQGSRAVGIIEDGFLLLPYIPFEKNTRIVLSLSAKDRSSIDIPIELGDEAPKVAAPALKKVDKGNILVGTGPGRLLGLGMTYRYFFRPDWSFLFINERLFAGFDFTAGSKPLVHAETWEGFGWYLLFPPSSPFRAGACVGGGFLFSFSSADSPTTSNYAFLDIAILPIEAFCEYRFKSELTLWLSARGAYSIDSSGLLGRGWLGNGTPDLSAGLLWRR